MDNFPNELIIQIYGFLGQEDQAQGRLVRRAWKAAMDDIHYRNIYIYSARALLKFLERMTEEPDIIDKIERLTINFPEDELIPEEDEEQESSQRSQTQINREIRESTIRNKNRVNELLFRARNLIALHTTVSGIVTRDHSVLPLAARIKVISEASNVSLVNHLLSARSCPNLEAIRSTTFSSYPLLYQSPGLTTLYLTRLDVQALTIDFQNFELIHRHVPNLESLRLLNLNFQGRMVFPQSFETAPGVTHFSANVVRGALSVLEYVTKKYPGLRGLEYEIGDLMSTPRQMLRLYTNGWMPFFARLGASLESLTYGSRFRDEDFIPLMDNTNCQISYLSLDYASQNLIEDLRNSRQAHFVETLVLKETHCYFFEFLASLPHLRKLKLINCRYDEFSRVLDLSLILEHAPQTLQSLSFESIYLATGVQRIYNRNITSLSFEDVQLSQNTLLHISMCLPALNRLKVKHCQVEIDAIIFTNISLDEFHFVGIREFDRNSKRVRIHTLANEERRVYCVNSYHRKVIHKDVVSLIDPGYTVSFSSIPYQLSGEEEYNSELTLVCLSVNKLFFV